MTSDAFLRGDIVWHTFSSREALADELATMVQSTIAKRQEDSHQACIAFSGGSTPKPLFEELSGRDIDWQSVLLTLVDERNVPESHELSNHGFINKHLLSQLDPRARFVSLFHGFESASENATKTNVVFNEERTLGKDQRRFDFVVLGMGGDGHTASFFPDAENIEALVSYSPEINVLTCSSPSTQVPRVTWSLAALLDTHQLILHITGQEKRDLFERATETDSIDMQAMMQWPIRAMAYQRRVPLNVFYSD